MSDRPFSLKGLSLERLRSLSSVVRDGGISRAAGGDSTRQTQFSRQIKELEEFFGAPLLDRSVSPHVATALAQELASASEEFLATVGSMASRVGEERQSIFVGAGEATLRALLVPLAREFAKSFPKVRLVFRNLTTRQVAAELTAQRLDLGIVDKGGVGGGMKSSRLAPWGMSLVAPGKVKSGKLKWEDLGGAPVVLLYSQGRFRRFLASMEESKGVRLDVVMECTSYPQALDAALVGGWATFAPDPLLDQLPQLSSRRATLPGLDKHRVNPVLAWNRSVTNRRPEVERLKNWLVEKLG